MSVPDHVQGRPQFEVVRKEWTKSRQQSESHAWIRRYGVGHSEVHYLPGFFVRVVWREPDTRASIGGLANGTRRRHLGDDQRLFRTADVLTSQRRLYTVLFARDQEHNPESEDGDFSLLSSTILNRG